MLLNKIKERLTILESFKKEAKDIMYENELNIHKIKCSEIPRLEEMIKEANKIPTEETLDFGVQSIERVLEYLKSREEQKILSASRDMKYNSTEHVEDRINKANYMIDIIEELLIDDTCEFWEDYYNEFEE